MMEENCAEIYSAPEIELIDIVSEYGFCASNSNTPNLPDNYWN